MLNGRLAQGFDRPEAAPNFKDSIGEAGPKFQGFDCSFNGLSTGGIEKMKERS